MSTGEHLGGFTVIDGPDDQHARDWWTGRLAVALDWPQVLHRFSPSPLDDAAGAVSVTVSCTVAWGSGGP